MRFSRLALFASAAVLGACGGGGDKGATKTDTAAAPPAAAPGGAAPAGPSVAAKPATGKNVEIKMIGDGTTYKFEPNNVTVKAGDKITFTNVAGGPHNVTFNADSIPAAGRAQLTANMPQQMSDLSGPLLNGPGETYEISTAGVAPGKYPFYCSPHLAMNMKGLLTITP